MSDITTSNIYRDMSEKIMKGVSAIGTYVVISIVIVYLYYQIYLASKDDKAITTNFIYNMFTIVVPIILVLGLIVFTSFEKDIRTYVIFGSLFVCAMIFIVFYFLKTSLSTYIFNDYLLYTVIALLGLVGLSIIFTLFSGTLRKLNGWLGFFSNLIFYIPCLIRDFVKELIQEYNSSSTTVLVLFVFEILLIIMYFWLLPLINDKSLPEKTVILDDPVMINTEMDMCSKLKDSTSSNFAISMWIYLNSMPKTKKSYIEETTIFNYSSRSVKNPHIKISYLNNERGSNDFFMYVGPQKFNISLPLQKWNNFVINYTTYDAEAVQPINNKKEVYANGDSYQGEMKIDGPNQIKEGKGKFMYANGDIYEGQWLDNKKNGLGKFTYAAGKVEEGKWLDNEQTEFFTYETRTGDFTGKGKIEYKDNSGSYDGDIKYGKRHGYGTMTYTTVGRTAEAGYWRNDVFQGEEEDNWLQSDDSDSSIKKYTVDIFINGVLERSYTFKANETPVFDKNDIMTVGAGAIGQKFQSDGLYGAICNIVYYKKPLSQLAIIYNYNLLSIKNPPIY
jgi:hypothetical protein